MLFSTSLVVGAAIGVWRLRRDCSTDWDGKLAQLQEERPDSSTMHIVIVPSYKESKDMMRFTLENLARSALAQESMYVVLAMEEREGWEAREKAANLIDETRHHFADIWATFHPANRPGEVAGKSSNVQWAYKQTLKRLAPQLNNCDLSHIFLSCIDADSLVHPQYFSAISYQGLCMSYQERMWTMWQAPIFLIRNVFSAPSPSRLACYGTILFELQGLAFSRFLPHLTVSCYTISLAMAVHPCVDGWDEDVIAEDHHMFCKCHFASIWEHVQIADSTGKLANGSKEHIKSMTKMAPVFLPVMGFQVESETGGYWSSLAARYTQARRHSQGVEEISYVVLQCFHLLKSRYWRHIAMSTHAKTAGLLAKMINIHIITPSHSVCFFLTLAMAATQWMSRGGISELLHLSTGTLSLQDLNSWWWVICVLFPIPAMTVGLSEVVYLAVKDALEGRCTTVAPKKIAPTEPAAPGLQGCAIGPNGLGLWKRIKLYLIMKFDTLSAASFTMLVYGVIPVSLAAWSLFFNRGKGFQFIVGSKPKNSA